MAVLRWLLFPISILYGGIIWIRNQLYDHGIFRSRKFAVRTIVIGNLLVGGSGKSPLTQKLINHFKNRFRLATLSRGYGRRTKGFRLVHLQDTAQQSGDEPLQFKKNHPEVTVAVDEKRARGIELLAADHDLIVLDDAFQHRKISGLCRILLFDYASITHPMWMLPTGNLRDTLDQTKRADIVLITKCPRNIPPEKKQQIQQKIQRRNAHCSLYYSAIQYHHPRAISSGEALAVENLPADFLLVTGIANPSPLVNYLAARRCVFQHLSFADHYQFKPADYLRMGKKAAHSTGKACILTTEKDAQRLDREQLKGIDLYYIPIEMRIQQEDRFLQDIENYLQQASR